MGQGMSLERVLRESHRGGSHRGASQRRRLLSGPGTKIRFASTSRYSYAAPFDLFAANRNGGTSNKKWTEQ